jgi:hypothetical protein
VVKNVAKLPEEQQKIQQQINVKPSSATKMQQKVQGGAAPVAMRKSAPHRATITKRTRTYVIEGVEVTSTTMHVFGEKQDYELRYKFGEIERLALLW